MAKTGKETAERTIALYVEEYIDIMEALNKEILNPPNMPYTLEQKIAYVEGWRDAFKKVKQIINKTG